MNELIPNIKDKKNISLLILAVFLILVISFLNVSLPLYIFLGLIIFIVIGFFIFKNPVIGIYLIAFFLPFERIGAYEFGGSTVRISQVLFIILLLIWLGRMIFQRKFDFVNPSTSLGVDTERPGILEGGSESLMPSIGGRRSVKNPLIIPLAIFLLFNILSLQNSLNLERSLLLLALIVFTILLSLVIPNLLQDKKTIEKTILILLISAFLVSVFGIFQFLGDMAGLPTTITGLRDLYTKDVLGFPRIQSTAYEPLYFANYLLIPLGVALSLFLSRKSTIKSSWLLILLIIGGISFVLTVARGAYLALAVVILIISLVYFRKVFTLRNIIIFTVVLVLVWQVVVRALGYGGDIFNLDVFQGHVLNVFYGASFNERIDTFENAMKAWREQPFVGIGVGGFGPYVAPHPYYMPKDGWRIVNNEFIEILAETGIMGAFAFFIIILVLIARSIKAIIKSQDKYLKAIMIALLAAFIGVLVQYQTFSTLYIMHVWFLIGLMIAVQNLVLVKQKV